MKQLALCLGMVGVFCVSETLAQRPSPQVRKLLVQQMIRDRNITEDCVRKEGWANVLGVSLLYLNRDKQPEYYVYGKGCATVGARRPAAWIYLRAENGYRKIFGGDEGEQSDLKLLKTRTNGYLDIQTSMYSGGQTYTGIAKFDGNSYQ